MKKILIIATVLLQIIGLTIVSSAADGLTISIQSSSAKPGEQVSLDVVFDNNPGIVGFQMDLSYDSAKLVLEKVEKNEGFSGYINLGSNSVSWFDQQDNDYNGIVFTMTFTVLESAGDGLTEVSFTNCKIGDSNENQIDCSISSGTIEIKSEHSHVWDSGKITKAATCTDKGEKTFTCTICGETKTESIDKDASNHSDYGTEITGAKAATCTAKGYTGDTVCKGCKAVISKGKDIEPVEHSLKKVKAKPATCTKAGNIEYYVCSDCGKTFTDAAGTKAADDITVPAKGHSYGEWTVADDKEVRVCSVCGASQTRDIDPDPEPDSRRDDDETESRDNGKSDKTHAFWKTGKDCKDKAVKSAKQIVKPGKAVAKVAQTGDTAFAVIAGIMALGAVGFISAKKKEY